MRKSKFVICNLFIVLFIFFNTGTFLLRADDGSGWGHIHPDFVLSGSSNKFIIIYQPDEGITNGAISVLIPQEFSMPQTNNPNIEGYVTFDAFSGVVIGNKKITGRNIEVTIKTMDKWGSVYIYYGANTNAIVPTGVGNYIFSMKSKIKNTGSFVSLNYSPQVWVKHLDGSGNIWVWDGVWYSSYMAVETKSTQEYIFKYAADFQLNEGEISLEIPAEFSEPQTNNSAQLGYVSISNEGNSSISNVSITGSGPWQINILIKTQEAGWWNSINIKYGKGAGAAAPSTTGYYTFNAKSKSKDGTLAPLYWLPQIEVKNIDGSGNMMVCNGMGCSGYLAVATKSTQEYIFKYEADFQLDRGEITFEIPADFSPPQTNNPAQLGYISISNGLYTSISNFSITGSGPWQINITAKTMARHGDFYIKYGKGAGAAAPSTAGYYTFTAKSRTKDGTLTSLINWSPQIEVKNIDGSGKMMVWDGMGYSSYLTVATKSTQEYIFQYTADFQLNEGEISLEIPAGFTPPQTNSPAQPGYVSISNHGNASISNFSITGSGPWYVNVTIKTIEPDWINGIYIKYGKVAGAAAPSTAGYYTFNTKSKSKDGTLTPLNWSPQIDVRHPDGSGNMMVWDRMWYSSYLTVATKSTQEYIFQYTADFQLNEGEISLEIPAGFTPPQKNSSAQLGYISISNHGNASVNNFNITGTGPWYVNVTIKTMEPGWGNHIYIKYGKVAGAAAPSIAGDYTFTAKSRTKDGILAPINWSPQIEVKNIDGSGRMMVLNDMWFDSQISVLVKSTQEYIFQYTADFQLNEGEISLEIPAGFTPPQTNNPAQLGYVSISNYGNASISNFYITGLGPGPWHVNVAIKTIEPHWGNHIYIKYGKGAGAVAPSIKGNHRFTAKSRNKNGLLTSLQYSPLIKVKTKDGSGLSYWSPFNSEINTTTDYSFEFMSEFNLNNGGISFEVPAEFPIPQTNSSISNGYIDISNLGGAVISNIFITNRIINITVKTLNKNGVILIDYKNIQNPSAAGTYYFNFKSKSKDGTLSLIERSPYVILYNSTLPSSVTTVSVKDNPTDNGKKLLVKWTNPNTDPDFKEYQIYISESPINSISEAVNVKSINSNSVTSSIISIAEDLRDYYIAVVAVDAGDSVSLLDNKGRSVAGPVYSVRNIVLTDSADDTIYSTYNKNTRVVFNKGENIGIYLDIIRVEDENNIAKVNEADLKSTINGFKYDSMKKLESTIGEFKITGTFSGTAFLYMNYSSSLSGVCENKLKILKLDEINNIWYILDLSCQSQNINNKCIMLPLRNFSILRIGESLVADDLSNVKIYPNPFKPLDGDFSTGDYNTGIKFINLTPKVKIKIYNIAGEFICTLNEENGDGIFVWNGMNENNDKLSSGIYIIYMQNKQNKKDNVIKKLAIIK